MLIENLHPILYAPRAECVSTQCCGNGTIEREQITDEHCCSVRDQVRCCIDEENIDRLVT